MRVDRISVGDIVKASIKGRTMYGEVSEVTDGVVHFVPLTPAAGWRHASAHDIVGHWRKAGRASTGGEGQAKAPREQLSLPGIHGGVSLVRGAPRPDPSWAPAQAVEAAAREGGRPVRSR